jgi:hypothetical protein
VPHGKVRRGTGGSIMTTVGKILVIINFVFSLLTGALIIMVFAMSTNWERSYRTLKGYYDVSQANVKTYAQENAETRAKADNDKKRLEGDVAEKLKKLQDAEDALTLAKNNLAAVEAQVKLAGASTQNATGELLRVKDELKLAQAKVIDREQKVVELTKTAKEQQDKAIQANIKARTYQERTETLALALEQLSRENEGLKTGKAAIRGQAERRAPPENVEGIVKNSNAAAGLVTISIGSDAGISKGNSLYVYRLAPKPQFLGEIRIVEVDHHEAVGRPVMAQRGGQLQAGDIVASQIMNQR